MSIITFWNDDREQSGKTLTSVAVATRMAIDRNFKVLLMSTSFRDSTMKNCFFGDEVQRNLKIFGGKSNNIAVENGIEGIFDDLESFDIVPDESTKVGGNYGPYIQSNRKSTISKHFNQTIRKR